MSGLPDQSPRQEEGLNSLLAAGGHKSPSLPLPPGAGEERVKPVAMEETFRFNCHPGVSCFTECCRELELALSPYDVARLSQALDLSSREFVEEYAIIEFTPEDLFPKVYLAMIDDGRASCPFITPAGCRVYQDRPAACRTYPVGRGASLDRGGLVQEQFVLITEPHCLGFTEERTQSVKAWQQEQGLVDYNRSNDLLLPLLMSARDQGRERLSASEAALFIDTLYGLDRLPAHLVDHLSPAAAAPDDAPARIAIAVNRLKEQWRSAP